VNDKFNELVGMRPLSLSAFHRIREEFADECPPIPTAFKEIALC
jgi:hypothetical protein